jgi:SAM-dependent methyltransferase
MRDEVLTRFVEQPDAAPIYQYLRDAEKASAWNILGEQGRVLDIASESNITAGLNAESIARTDFSETAIEFARDVLGEDVDRYEWTEPESPNLPFPDDHFDAAVSIGPYDWRFLDIETLTSEVHRILRPDGLFVFSVPTPRSPYWTGGRYRLRYYTPDEATRMYAPEFRLIDSDPIYQLPYWLHSKLAMGPDFLQPPFVNRAAEKSAELTGRDDWDDASYLVLGVTPFDYAGDLDQALSCLFRSTDENGFWDASKERFVRALEYNIDGNRSVPRGHEDLTWTPTDDIQWRYAPFALMGVMQWRVSELGDSRYDTQLRAQLEYFVERARDSREEMPSYGIGPLICAFSLAHDVFGRDYLETARELGRYGADRFDWTNSEDSLLLYGLTYLHERSPGIVDDAIDEAMYEIVDQQNAWKTLFYFNNPTTRRHQNQMYTLWALCRGIEVTDRFGYLENVEAVLDYTINERMREDGAFIWEDPSNRAYASVELRRRLGHGKGRPPHWEFLYSCHQTFFVNAVSHYYDAGGDSDYDRELGEAMAWLKGTNALDTNLAELSGLGVPMRFLSTDGRMDVPDQMFKGAYEIGSLIMALTNLR